MFRSLWIVVFIPFCTWTAQAEVVLPSLISDHMVLQRDIAAAVWGWADPGEEIRVSFRDQRVQTQASEEGSWLVRLRPMAAGGPDNLTIEGKNAITVRDVLVGEVWIASGQSNMQWPVSRSNNAEAEIAGANYPEIRLFSVERKVAEAPQMNVVGHWTPTTPASVGEFSAVAYYFGRDLHQQLEVPLGLVHSSWGGTPAESWTSREALQSNLSLHPILWNWKKTLLEYPFALKTFEEEMSDWEVAAAQAKAEGKSEPRRPRRPQGPGHTWTPSGLYNAMIAPLTLYAIRGVIWYQGEANARPYRSLEYRQLFRAMIQDWRDRWDQGPFPFLFVQLANYREREARPVESSWAEVQEAQRMTLSLPNTGMAVTIDIGEANDIHPTNKQDVGHRLALAARAVAYGEHLVYSGPLYKGMLIEGNRIRVLFDHIGGGLRAREEKLKDFAIAGRDRQFVWADAQIDGDSVVVSSAAVPNPVAVRYAWQDNPDATLYNMGGLPASPFRTDDWSAIDP